MADWEQRKLIEEADFFDEKRIPIDSEKRVQGRYPYYGATGVIDYVDNYIFDGEYILLAEDGANIITRNSPVAYITEGKFWLNNHAHIMKMKLGSNLFLLQLLERQNYEKFNSGTAQPKLNGQIVKNMIFNFPSYKEQNKIGNFFKLIDDAIALHQRKLALLKQLKQTYLQVMFPQNGRNIPSLRFAGFSEPWEQRKLETQVIRIRSYSLSREVETDKNTGYKYIHYGDIHTKVANLIEKSSALPNIRSGNYDLLQKGDLILADASEDYQGIAMPAVVTMTPPYNLVAGLHTIALRPIIVDALFLFYLIQSPIFREYGRRIGTGMKVFGISATNVLNFESNFPSVNEQEKIGKLLKKTDDTLALQQYKLEKLLEYKQVLLDKMFF